MSEPRSLSAELRHFTGTWTVCVTPLAYVFGFIQGRAFVAAFLAGLVLLISTVRPTRRADR